MSDPLLILDLSDADVKSIIWATGFKADYRWMKLDVLDKEGRPRHQRGISPEAGIYLLGLPWQSRRASSFLWAVWHDAKFIADQIAIQKAYRNFRPSVRRLRNKSASIAEKNVFIFKEMDEEKRRVDGRGRPLIASPRLNM